MYFSSLYLQNACSCDVSSDLCFCGVEAQSRWSLSPLSDAPCLWGRIQYRKGWDKNLQTETEKEREHLRNKTNTVVWKGSKSYLFVYYSQEPFWWWDFSHRHSGVCNFLWKQQIQILVFTSQLASVYLLSPSHSCVWLLEGCIPKIQTLLLSTTDKL